MPGGRLIAGRDVRALARHLGSGTVDPDLVEAWVAVDAQFAGLADLARACPPERIGLSPGVFSALFGPLFGEFE